MVRYQKTQYNFWITALFVIPVVWVIYAYYFQLGSRPIPLVPAVLIASLFVIINLLFYKMMVIIDHTNITVTFGIGLIKKVVPIASIKKEGLKKVKMPWYYGIGIRITPKGILYNMKFGDAVLIPNEKGTFLIGSNDCETIIATLK